ncbi:Tn3 family transposase [Massilia sp. CCM 8695]|uniref:Tn3 family transposase n=1 Tax=Massilia frigida TaxID=2609281 RepID=A0ABX0NGR9_9BURK|nr:Tn3 family transposase [Massilia frigida]
MFRTSAVDDLAPPGHRPPKNRRYFAFHERGRVIRTQFLLKYIDGVELWRTIHARRMT